MTRPDARADSEPSSAGRAVGLPDHDLRVAAGLRVPVMITAGDREYRSLCARLVHAYSESDRGPFVTYPVRTAGTPAAPSGGGPPEPGNPDPLRHYFEQARGGTLFIDDLSALDGRMQAQLFSLLDERGSGPPPAHVLPPARQDVRIITGVSRPIEADLASGAVNEALFYRLNVVHLA